MPSAPSLLKASFASLAFIAATATSARAQENGLGFLVGYGILSAGAIHSLATRGPPPKLGVGSRIRLRLRGSDQWSENGKVDYIDADSVVVHGWLNGRYARDDIDSIRVKASTGRWAEGWAVGLIIGGVVGAGLGSRAYDDEYLGSGTPARTAFAWGTIMGVSTSTLAAGVGLLLPSRYATVRNEPGSDSRLSVLPTLGRPGFVARVKF